MKSIYEGGSVINTTVRLGIPIVQLCIENYFVKPGATVLWLKEKCVIM